MSENQVPGQEPEFTHNLKPSDFSQQVPPVTPYGQFGQMSLPNSTPVLVLGILAILSCCCYGVPGLILGIIGLVLGNKDLTLYKSNPDAYTESSYKNSKAGRICSIIALILSVLYVLFIVAIVMFFGFAALQDPQHMKEVLEGMRNQ
ncbi:CCC motif membrane protein [Pedobacter sp. JCM 36344]|uniref:CCC motif membrane protein n=1 Tax=Pedobacter sp. JCM 36344 TaxID=3374280 RepID=UPI00397E7D4C